MATLSKPGLERSGSREPFIASEPRPDAPAPRPTRSVRVTLSRVVGRALHAVARVIAAVVVAATTLPVVLLFVVSSVPLLISVALVAADVALLLALLRLERTPTLVGAVFAGLVAVSLFAVIASQRYATTPPIVDASGAPVVGSIASLEAVTLGGSRQWITIRGRDARKPVLLFLAGGPGGSELTFARNVLGGLEEHFIVVNWDQPGAGKSFGAVPRSALTLGRFVADGHELTLLLRERFHQEKIYLLGAGWGTVPGTLLVQRWPELFHAYIGAGQRTSVHEDDVAGYGRALAIAAEHGDAALVKKLRRNGPPPYSGWSVALKNLDYRNVLNAYAREHARGELTGHDLVADAITGTEYGLADRVNWFRGLWRGFTTVYPQLDTLDFARQARTLGVPVYFLQGRYDLVEMGSLLERWYRVLDAPHKEIIWFENSGHTPHAWEPTKVVDVLASRVLPETVAPPVTDLYATVRPAPRPRP
ncbi:MAG TPA: alpha/beta hydrolase [Gemmatimonadaceae bacterium]|nr:alpha/beta hydrolase [Gemmatimonadaceae bacterium]